MYPLFPGSLEECRRTQVIYHNPVQILVHSKDSSRPLHSFLIMDYFIPGNAFRDYFRTASFHPMAKLFACFCRRNSFFFQVRLLENLSASGFQHFLRCNPPALFMVRCDQRYPRDDAIQGYHRLFHSCVIFIRKKGSPNDHTVKEIPFQRIQILPFN